MSKKRNFFEAFRPTRVDSASIVKEESPIVQKNVNPNDLAIEESTEFKLAILSSLLPNLSHTELLELLLSCDGSVDKAADIAVSQSFKISRSSSHAHNGNQSSLATFFAANNNDDLKTDIKQKRIPFPLPPIPKGKTIHISTPELVPLYTPCTFHPSFLPSSLATSLLQELLDEAPTYGRQAFRLFDRNVISPHSACFYVSDADTGFEQKKEYLYNGNFLEDVRQFTPTMSKIVPILEKKVNEEINKRAQCVYPDGKKLKYQMKLGEWRVNTAFVNCYDGAKESVGWHSDQLTYLGPRAVIATISLGVAREFRLRRVAIPCTGDEPALLAGAQEEFDISEIKAQSEKSIWSESEGQSSIHVTHNSLLIMHAETQESYKHSVHPASTITPHPLAQNKRISITYRCYRKALHPKHTPRCTCGVPAILRSVQRKEENLGKYFWMCHAGNAPDGANCAFFQWAEFTDDGEPIW